MSQINLIEKELEQIEGGRFQTLANQYLYRKYSLNNIVELGSQCGTDKTTTGVPDMYSIKENGHYLFAAYSATTSKDKIRAKLLDDARNCLDQNKTHIDPQFIDRIIVCHTFFRLSPSIAQEVCDIDPRIEIIGPETIASDLNRKYPALAHLIWNIPLGKGSFIAPNRFIERNEKGRFTTDPSKPLMYRESELLDIVNSIEQSKVVVIQGQSGSGKTKIALEACKSFSKEHHWDFLVLDSRYSANLDEDIELILSKSENLVVLVDDANTNLSLEHLLSVCTENDKLKIIFTCRKMNKRELTSRINNFLKYKEIELIPLTTENIDTILKTEYGIKNWALRERVSEIAKGNLRLAIMAASTIRDGDYEAIREPYDLLNVYMDSVLSRYSDREKRLAEIFAIYDFCDLIKGDSCYDDLLKLGYDDTEIREFVFKLDKQEIITRLVSADDIVAIKMEEQNLRDYLICRHFAKEKNGSFADFILHTAELPNPPYFKVAKSMAEVCGSESVNEYIRKECERAWDKLKNQNVRIANQFITVFHQFLPVQALAFVSECIERTVGNDVSEDILNSNSTSDGSMALHICISLMNADKYSQTALELFMECVEKGTEQASEYNWACGQNCAFSYYYSPTEFKMENKKLDILVSRYQKTHSRNIAACLIVLANTYLSSRANHIRRDGNTYSFNTLTYNFTPKLAELHAHCFQSLSTLIGTEYENRVKSTFRQHFSLYSKELERKNAEKMYSVLTKIEDLFPTFLDKDSTINLSCSLDIKQIYETCAQNPPLNLDNFTQSTFDALAIENYKSIRSKEPKLSPIDLSLDRLTEALHKLAEDYELSSNKWESGEAIKEVLLEIAKKAPNNAVNIVAHCISSLPLTIPVPYKTLDFLAETTGRKTLRNELSTAVDINDYPDLFEYLDLQAIKSGPDERELDEILIRLNDGKTHLSLKDLEIIEERQPGYILDYATRLSECAQNDWIWKFFGNYNEEECISSLESNFKSNPLPVIKLYFQALKGFPHFDYNLAILRSLLHIEESMFERAFEYISSLDFHQRHDLLQRISSFWIDKDEKAWNFLKAFIDKALSDPFEGSMITDLFHACNTVSLNTTIFWNRLKILIKENISDAESLYKLSWAFSDCEDETRVRAITLILTLDKDGISINHLELRRSSMVGTLDNGYIPGKIKEIEALKTIIERLPADALYIKHKEWISKVRLSIEKDIENEKWKLLHGKQ